MGAPSGFAWTRRKNGDVVITHHGRRAAVLRGARALDFVDDVPERDGAGDSDDAAAQELMARLTGNYKRGNERQWRR